MSVISQLNLPYEVQELVREFAYYSRIEWVQRKLKRHLVLQLNCCERLFWKDVGQYYDYFYYRMENWGIYTFEPNVFYITQESRILSTLFCKHCHNYVTTDTQIPACIECDCAPEWLNVD